MMAQSLLALKVSNLLYTIQLNLLQIRNIWYQGHTGMISQKDQPYVFSGNTGATGVVGVALVWLNLT